MMFVCWWNGWKAWLQVQKDPIHTYKEASAQTDSVPEPVLERLCQEVSDSSTDLEIE